MTTTAAPDELGRAAFQLRNPFHLPGLGAAIDPDLAAPLANLLDYIGREHPQVDMDAKPSCGPDCNGHSSWSYCRRCGGFVICETRENALAVARIVNQPPEVTR